MLSIQSNSTSITPESDKITPDSLKAVRCKAEPTVLKRFCQWFSPYKAAKELCSPLLWHDVFLETVLSVFVGCSITWVGVTLNPKAYQPSVFSFGLYAGFLVFALGEGWGTLGGCCINVSITVSMFISGRLPAVKCLLFFIVDVGGAAAGAMLGRVLTPEKYHANFFPVIPGEGMTDFQAVMVEAILTFNLIIVVLVVTDGTLKPSAMGAFPVGFCFGTGILAAGTHTGGLQNPTVALIYAMNANYFKHHWIYWVGPIVGSTVATIVYLILAQVRDRYGPNNKAKVEPEIAQTYSSNNNDTIDKNGYNEKVEGLHYRPKISIADQA